jgi:hypothetical protein
MEVGMRTQFRYAGLILNLAAPSPARDRLGRAGPLARDA